MGRDTAPKLAVLIGADNARFSIINQVLSEIANYGTKSGETSLWKLEQPEFEGLEGQAP